MACAAYAACAPDFLYLEGGFCSFFGIPKTANARVYLIRQSLHYLLCFRSLRGKIPITRPCGFCICSTSPQGHETSSVAWSNFQFSIEKISFFRILCKKKLPPLDSQFTTLYRAPPSREKRKKPFTSLFV